MCGVYIECYSNLEGVGTNPHKCTIQINDRANDRRTVHMQLKLLQLQHTEGKAPVTFLKTFWKNYID